jgi:2-dehydropantoate 2-reductase
MQDRRGRPADDERGNDRPPGLRPPPRALAAVPDVQRLELDPVLAKELPGRGAGSSGRLPEQRHALHSGMIAAVKIAVVGAGAMGSVYAGLLGSAGHEVWAIDRWREHVEAIRERGLRVEGASGDRVVPIRATTDPTEAGEVDLVILATKAMDVEAAAGAARPLVGADTLVLSIQNGLGGPDVAARVLGEDRVAVGVAGGFGASVVEPGHVHHHGLELIRLGERHGPLSPRIEEVAEVWRGAGFSVRTFDDVQRLVWEKLVCNVAFSGTCTVVGRTIGEVIADADAWSVAAGCAAEAFAVGRASGVELGFDDPVAYVRDFGQKIPGAKPSMLLDLEAGRASEVDFINGAIPRVGREVGVGAPFNEAVTSLVKALERR